MKLLYNSSHWKMETFDKSALGVKIIKSVPTSLYESLWDVGIEFTVFYETVNTISTSQARRTIKSFKCDSVQCWNIKLEKTKYNGFFMRSRLPTKTYIFYVAVKSNRLYEIII